MPMPALRRFFAALLGSELAMALVALVEARSCVEATADKEALGRVALATWGLLAPFGLLTGVAAAIVLFVLDPRGPTSPRALAALIRSEPVLTRSRTAAFAPLLIAGGFAWAVASAHLARRLLARGDAAAVGAELAFGATLLLVALLALVLAAVAPLRRGLALGAGKVPQLVDPVATGGAAALIVVLTLAWGARAGDTGGDGEGPLAIFGVLRRNELDLRPVTHALAGIVGAWFGPLLVRRRGTWLETSALAVAAFLPLGLVMPAAKVLDDAPPLARVIERHAPMGRVALAVLRRATDRDRDGFSSTFGGGDCDDRDARRGPGALDVPGNSIDEDCSGADTPRVEAANAGSAAVADANRPHRVSLTARPELPDDLSVILITIDTLRTDLGFLGYDLAVSPNLDRLAEKSVVFERAYAPASYTGKSVGPVLIGKYPSETLRNGSHFNTYEPANLFFAERLSKAGFKTFGAASHWYFLPWSGITQGFAEFDLSAKPSSGQGDTDTSVTSKELTDASLRLLSKPENTSKRFFMWAHYFDPHAQYMEHAGAPSFVRAEAKGYVHAARAAYDGEVWFTDKHLGRLLDRIASSPFADRTAIVVTSDHGEAFAEHNMNWHGIEIWESIVRVPLLVYVPGITPQRVSARRSLVDLVPTLMELLAVPAESSDEFSGESMMSDLFPVPGAKPTPRDVYLDMPAGPYNGVRRALITGPGAGMKILHFGGTQYSVFNLDDDPGELRDLASEPAVLDALVQKLQTMRGRLHEIDVKPLNP